MSWFIHNLYCIILKIFYKEGIIHTMKLYLLLLTLSLTFFFFFSTPVQPTYSPDFSVTEADSSETSNTQIPSEIIPFHDDFPDGV